MRAAQWLIMLLGIAAGRPAMGGAQETPPRITVRVRQVAGTSVYFDVGNSHGLATGDTLSVYRSQADGGEPVGHLVVVASTDERSVLTFVGDPFPVTRGAALTLQLLRTPREAAPEVPDRAPPPSVAPPAAPPAPATAEVQPGGMAEGAGAAGMERPRPPAHGRIGFDLSAVRSTTRVGEPDPLSVGRTFATPAVRFDVTVPDAVGPLRLRTSMRMAYRYSSEDIVQPATSTRVYAAALEGDFRHLRVALGRFHSPVEAYSGFWDGAMVRVGGPGAGVGAIAGFEPDRWNEKPSTDVPKVTAFVDARSRGEGWRWSGDLSAHAVRPRNGEPNHTFVGASQRLWAGPVRLSHDVEVDKDPAGGSWRISRLRVRGSLDLGPGVQLRGGVARREAWIPGLLLESPFGSRSDRADVGLWFRGDGGFLSMDVSGTKTADGRRTWGASGSFMAEHLPGFSTVGLFGTVARWSGSYGSSISAAPALSFDLDPAWLRLGYRMNRSDYLRRVSLTHAVEGSLDVPFASGLRASGRFRVQFGGYMTSQSFNVTLYRIF